MGRYRDFQLGESISMADLEAIARRRESVASQWHVIKRVSADLATLSPTSAAVFEVTDGVTPNLLVNNGGYNGIHYRNATTGLYTGGSLQDSFQIFSEDIITPGRSVQMRLRVWYARNVYQSQQVPVHGLWRVNAISVASGGWQTVASPLSRIDSSEVRGRGILNNYSYPGGYTVLAQEKIFTMPPDGRYVIGYTVGPNTSVNWDPSQWQYERRLQLADLSWRVV